MICGRLRTILAACCCVAAFARAAHAQATPAPAMPFKDPSLPFNERIADLLKRLSPEEKANQLLMQISPGDPEVRRLGIPPMNWWTEGIHGVARAGRATVFPQAIALAAAWDPLLMQQIADVVATEARAKLDPAGSQYRGIIIWSPTINMARDPRWGRFEETYGEDPHLTGRLAVSFIKGLQGDDPKYLKTAATPKHFAMHSQETSRSSRSFDCPETVLRDYYLPAFHDCIVEGKAASIMAAFNGINGVPAHANTWLLNDVLRKEWGFDGAVASDCDAIFHLYSMHRYVSTQDQAVVAAINAGIDELSYWTDGSQEDRMRSSILQAIRNKSLSQEALDRALTRNLMLRFRLGMFDPPEKVPFARTPASAVGAPAHQALALKAALESIVLLKNDPAPRGTGMGPAGKILPLDLRRIDSIAVLGPYANTNQYGAYSGDPANPAPTIAAAIRAAVGDRIVVRTESSTDQELNTRAAQASDVVIFVCGLNGDLEKEGADRSNLSLPASQQNLLTAVCKANPLTIILIEGGSPVALPPIAAEKAPAILMAWYPGEQGGPAIAQLLLGQANPSGKLPVTFYRDTQDLPPLDDYDIRKGRTYMYATKPPTYTFGTGLSYTTFDYQNLRVSPTSLTATSADPKAALTATLQIANTGTLDGDEVVQLYIRQTNPTASQRPLKRLHAFQRLSIPAGQSRPLTLTVPLQSLGFWNPAAKSYTIEKGTYEILLGTSSTDIRAKSEITIK